MEKQVNISEVFANLSKSDLLKSNGKTKEGIYKKNVFAECTTDREKKSLRIKLRRKLDQFLGAYLANKNKPEQMTELKKVWNEYANNIYNDIKVVCDNNTDNEKQKLVEKFLQAMNTSK